jgi:hypothetical protein
VSIERTTASHLHNTYSIQHYEKKTSSYFFEVAARSLEMMSEGHNSVKVSRVSLKYAAVQLLKDEEGKRPEHIPNTVITDYLSGIA